MTIQLREMQFADIDRLAAMPWMAQALGKLNAFRVQYYDTRGRRRPQGGIHDYAKLAYTDKGRVVGYLHYYINNWETPPEIHKESQAIDSMLSGPQVQEVRRLFDELV